MKTGKHTARLALLLIAALGISSCKGSQQNANQQNSNQAAAQKASRWIAQYRSPSSAKFAGTNLAVFSYSSLSVVSPSVVFVTGDMPNPKSPDERTGVVVSTTDGGQTWKETLIESPDMKIPTLNSIHFVNPSVGWMVGLDLAGNGVVLKTTDAGVSWAASNLNFRQKPTSVFFADESNGWMGGATPLPGEEEGTGGPSDILATTDGGLTWFSQRRVSVSISDIFFLDRNTGWATGSNGSIYHTTDGGKTWNNQRSELESEEAMTNPKSEAAIGFKIFGVHFTDSQNGFAAASGADDKAGRVLATTNGGAAWSRKLITNGEGIRDVYFASPNEGWAITDSGHYIYYTVDGGKYWLSDQVTFDQDVPFHKIAGSGAKRVWAVGGGAIFFRLAE